MQLLPSVPFQVHYIPVFRIHIDVFQRMWGCV
jgi:hypothetical protein